MRGHSLISAGLRIFAIVLVVIALRQSAEIMLFMEHLGMSLKFAAAVFMAIGFPLLLAGILWRYSYPIAQKVAPDPFLNKSEDPQPLGEPDIFRVGVTLLGMYFFASALASLSYQVISIQRAKNLMNDAFLSSSDTWIRLAATSTELIIGLVFFVGSGSLVRFYVFVKELGVREDQEQNQ
ncbi:hypothetical protein AN478_00200 [Thiohalorhabdus denitrificans]|uniref:Uncharacterized protein n=1 Tax=Thiohalorhabdus denitrificans TaxID=381306 RepID=A0A0P9CR59_9GAMM|nr:hypothetical protein [Thiohalorhabdus denitrificans]KPV41862.1 hypothetical protein AN478_00200 [Thiohalorhabdus denitrificans]SCY64812.1 hypothetical protein SAMN05661077_0010 [Thiohalorhabdus denitrificans]